MIHVEESGRVPIVAAKCNGMSVVQLVDAYSIRDDNDVALCVVLPKDGTGDILAHRIAHLLETYGVHDIPNEVPT